MKATFKKVTYFSASTIIVDDEKCIAELIKNKEGEIFTQDILFSSPDSARDYHRALINDGYIKQ
jgi:hypothetical protein